ncbi:hypothetical protein Asulf_01963 [Archaeoglobus sulfaticallidus PM70-1]|uniref:Uncharacterized protein n=1 Tax=Archaeoglobus sulfaticallidus PM70-1 TaxID=387631 RepID=N0BE76_9EURY|nr:MBL fold metallo-hydrolase [Archaeoglobus sulfaticallidus]AGK61929.1 hypothetical protein Asulf_01963 [Archaeoglobus sulfaticallidus PM70-1]
MDSIYFLDHYGFFPYRRKSGKGAKPHISLRFNFGEVFDVHIDTYAGKGSSYINLITHAHSDHYGQYNLDNPNAIASQETARMLSVLNGKRFIGRTFEIGKEIKLNGLRIKTYPTEHIFGSSAFLIESESRILITGDVKDYRKLPRCDVLITEATYGKPDFTFEEEIDKLINEAKNSVLGVYPIGKAQRTAKILSENGYSVSGEDKITKLCKAFDIDVSNEGDVKLVSPRNLYSHSGRKYILTAQRFYRIPRIVISDHLDFNGLIDMIEHCNPEHVIFYHGKPSEELLQRFRSSILKDFAVLSEEKLANS